MSIDATILIVEDEAISAQYLGAVLRAMGCRVLEPVVTGEQAMKVATTQRPDLVLMDIMLAGPLDGIEAARRIHDELDIPVVYVTAHSDEGVLKRITFTEPFGLITKPVSEAQLQATIPLALANHAMRRSLKESEQRYRDLWIRSQRLEVLGQLSAGVAHDFNSLLTVILGHAGLLMNEPSISPRQVASAQQIKAATKRGAQLIRQMLAFTRNERVQTAPMDLNLAVSGFAKLLRRLLGESVAFEFEPEAGLPTTVGDVGRIEQVLLNLAVNARDAMPNGGKLRVRSFAATIEPSALSGFPHACPAAKAGRFVCLEVADTGCGIEPASLPRVFEPFFTTKPVGEGTGLGLATVADIVKLHEGWIHVQSKLGQGSTFTVYLPASDQPAEAMAEEAEAPIKGGAGETVLLVEDSTDVRVLCKAFLQDQGYRVLDAESGREALALWERWQTSVELLLTDVVLPHGFSGLELARRLREFRPGLKVLYTSGYELALGTELRPGVNFLRKPFPLDRLAGLVRSTLDAKAGGGEFPVQAAADR